MNDDGNIFTEFLTEHNARRPVVNVVARKRERFARLHHMLLKCVFVQNYDKGWHVGSYMRRLLEEDEYPDEHVAQPLETVFQYLDVIIAMCTYESQRDLQDCIRFCEESIETCGIMYPILFKILAGCYLKLHQLKKATSTVKKGLKFIMKNFREIEDVQLMEKDKKSLFVIRRLGDNTGTHIFFVLYTYSNLLNMDVNETVQTFVEGRASPCEFQALKSMLQTRFDCCYGSQLGHVLNQQMVFMSINAIFTMKNYYKLLEPVCHESHHVGAHCSIMRVVVNCDEWNEVIFVRGFQELHLAFKLCPDRLCYDTISNEDRIETPGIKLPKRHTKITFPIGKPRRLPPIAASRYKGKMSIFYTKSLLPLLEQIIRHMRLDCEVLILYHELLEGSVPAYKLFERMETTSIRILTIHRRCSTMLGSRTPLNTRKFLRYHMRLITKGLMQWRSYIQVFVRGSMAKCVPKQRIQSLNELLCVMRSDAEAFYDSLRFELIDAQLDELLDEDFEGDSSIGYIGENNNDSLYNPIAKATKGTQTSYGKFYRSKQTQTQTDKYCSEEQIAALEAALARETAKLGDIELLMGVMKETKCQYMENHNRTVKALKKEVGQTRRALSERNQEIAQQKTQIEQLQSNLSKLNKSYSHAVKPPEESPKVSTKNIVKENEKLQVLNANIQAENESLRKQLAALTEEFDNIKASRDKLADEKSLLESKLKEKSDQYDELYGMCCLNMETEEKLKQKEAKLVQIKNVLGLSVRGCVDAFIEKITNYRRRCERIYSELTSYFYLCTPNVNNKQMCESNQMFLASLARQLDRNMHLIIMIKDDINDESLNNIEAFVRNLDWKEMLMRMEEFSTALFNQYVQSLNSNMSLYTALNHALVENARLVNQNRTTNNTMLMEPESFCRPHYHQQSYPDRGGFTPKVTTSQVAAFGAIGSNRPHNSWSIGVRSQASDIQDPNTKTILSQIGHAVNLAKNTSHGYIGTSTVGTSQGLDPSQGVIRRASNPSPTLDNHQSGLDAAYRPRMEPTTSSMKENLSASEGPEFANAKYRDIFLAIKKRFPTALRNDLINALNFLGRMNSNMHKMSMENIFINVANYIERQMQIRLKASEVSERPSECTKDEVCSICFENMNVTATITLKCQHVFHEKCLKMWIQQNSICPICRQFATLN